MTNMATKSALAVIDYLEKRFGIPRKVFDGYVIAGDLDEFTITTRDAQRFDRIRAVRRGIKFASVYRDLVKLSTAAVQMFGAHATKNTIELTDSELKEFVRGGILSKPDDGRVIEEGPVIARHMGLSIGLGIFRNGRIKSQVPREKRIEKLLSD
jgi:NOL1/NOP2/fmu family ribosome biogenesis protein